MEACDDNIDSKSKESGENMKRKIYQIVGLALLSAALWTPMASAQVVTATGQGTDEQAAIRDASRNAVEQVVGTLVDAKTIVSGGAVDLDQIYTKSQGFVKDVQVLEKSQANGMVTVRASIDVDTRPRAELMNNLQMLLKLNDPRIAVIVLKQDADGNVTGHDLTAEGAMNQRLLDLGFTHVVDAGIVSGNIYLYCAANSLVTVCRASMDRDALKKALKLKDNIILHLNHPVGYTAEKAK